MSILKLQITISERDLARARGDRERHPVAAERLNALYRIETIKKRIAALDAPRSKIYNRLYSRYRFA